MPFRPLGAHGTEPHWKGSGYDENYCFPLPVFSARLHGVGGLIARGFAGPHGCRQGGAGPDHGGQGLDHPVEHSSAGHLRWRGSGADQGSFPGGRAVWAGRGDLPHRAWVERAGVYPHGRRFVRVSDWRPVHGPDPGGGERPRLPGPAQGQVQDWRRRFSRGRPGGPQRNRLDGLEDERRVAQLLAQQGPVCRHRPGRHEREPELRGHGDLLRPAASIWHHSQGRCGRAARCGRLCVCARCARRSGLLNSFSCAG
jgi:hypothetical protein